MDNLSLMLTAAALGAVSIYFAIVYLRTRISSRSQYLPALVLDSVAQHRLKLLQQAFPSQAVLANQRMDSVLRVIRSPDKARAQERAARHVAQFVVLGFDGRPEVLFESDQVGRRGITTERELRKKYALAKFAGIPMVRIRSNDDIASPAFRQRVELAIEKARARSKGAKVDAMNQANDTAMPNSIQAILPKNRYAAMPR
jgi:hypothetical protein